MPVLDPHLQLILRNPGSFVWRTIKAFRANQGLLLAGAVAYYALLSIVPLLILIVIFLSRYFDQADMLHTMSRYVEWLMPGQSRAIISELGNFLLHRDVVGPVLLVSMLFFSSLAFTVLENAMSVIFLHRANVRRRHFLISALMPYCFIMFLGLGSLIVTVVSGGLQAMGEESLALLGHSWSLGRFSRVLLYFLGLSGEICVLTAVYLVMPVGRLSLRHALLGGVTAALLWEITRHILVWYFATLSQASVVYGSLTTAILVLLSLEMGATLLLFGAQVISEYERVGQPPAPP